MAEPKKRGRRLLHPEDRQSVTVATHLQPFTAEDLDEWARLHSMSRADAIRTAIAWMLWPECFEEGAEPAPLHDDNQPNGDQDNGQTEDGNEA